MSSQSLALFLIASGIGLFALIPLARSPRRRQAGLFDEIRAWLARTPFDRMTPVERRALVVLLQRAEADAGEAPRRAAIQVMLAEIALVAGDRELAAIHFRSALQADPSLPVRRTIEKLDAPAQLLSPRGR